MMGKRVIFIIIYGHNDVYTRIPIVDNNSEHERTCSEYFSPNMSKTKICQGNITLVRGRQVLMT